MYNNKKVAAVVAAGGLGTRFGTGINSEPKQFAQLLGKPVIVMSALLVQNHPYIDFAVMVMHGNYLDMWREIADSFRLSKFIYTVSGKENRQSSVFAGIKAAVGDGAKDLIIAIHDGARPLASEEIFTEAIEAADFYGGAVAAVPSRDTIKIVKDGIIAATPDRNAYYLAQTPQVFRAELLLKAYEAAMAEGFTGTDDASLVERVGGIVKITKGSHRNIKITAPEDIAIAETLIHKP